MQRDRNGSNRALQPRDDANSHGLPRERNNSHTIVTGSDVQNRIGATGFSATRAAISIELPQLPSALLLTFSTHSITLLANDVHRGICRNAVTAICRQGNREGNKGSAFGDVNVRPLANFAESRYLETLERLAIVANVRHNRSEIQKESALR